MPNHSFTLDFVVLHEDPAILQQCQEFISQWLKGMGLELHPNKTQIVHTLNPCGDRAAGFEFLGFTIRQYPVGKHLSGKLNGSLLGFKTITKPSNKKQRAHYDQIAKVIDAHKSAPQAALIRHLNPIIRGWSNYYSRVASKTTYSRLDHLVTQKLVAWTRHRHPGKAWEWVRNKYWHTIGGNRWIFAQESGGKREQLHLSTGQKFDCSE
jgi:RNA-directed DNA polymerase